MKMKAGRTVLLVLLALTIISMVTVTGLLIFDRKEEKCVRPTGAFLATIERCDDESVTDSDGVLAIPVIPLHWNRATKTYDVTMTVGSSEVTAAFDTGSAGMILRTPACKSCRGAKVYSPLSEGVKDAAQTLCRSSISYVSQTNVLQMYSDTVTFNRKLARQEASDAAARTCLSHIEAAPLVITDFPIGGMVESSGSHDSVNVFGVSGVKSVNQAKTGGEPSFPTSACRSTKASTYESALLQSVAAANPHLPLRWSIKFSVDRVHGGASVALGATQAHRGKLITVPAVKRLPNAPSEMVGTPWRYYIVEVLHARHTSAAVGDAALNLLDFPRYLIIDTATTQFMIPGSTSATSLMKWGLTITLNDTAQSELAWPGSDLATAFERKQDYSATELDTPLFTSMPSNISREFSTSSRPSVGILGALAMRGRYIEFACSDHEADARTIAFAFA